MIENRSGNTITASPRFLVVFCPGMFKAWSKYAEAQGETTICEFAENNHPQAVFWVAGLVYLFRDRGAENCCIKPSWITILIRLPGMHLKAHDWMRVRDHSVYEPGEVR